MRIYLMRHGEAEQILTGSDHDRQLTERGIRRIRLAARVLVRLGIEPAHIYCSPRVRATQTAEIIAKALDKSIEVQDAVNVDFNVEAIRGLTTDLSDRDEVMFVGHNPSMGVVTSALTGARAEFKPGGFARIDVLNPETYEGILSWLIQPKVFNLMDEK